MATATNANKNVVSATGGSIVRRFVVRILVFVYVILPIVILLITREPEITATISRNSTVWMTVIMVSFIITILSIRKAGFQGFVICSSIALGVLLYVMDTMLWQPPNDMNLSGTIAIITGANSGIGKATALAMTRMGAHVIVTCRSLQRCQQTVNEINNDEAAASKSSSSRRGYGRATPAVLNLSSLESVYNLTKQLTAEYPSIHYLFNNAGSTPVVNLTNEGLEDGFGGMHLAHMALTLGLLPSLRNAGQTSRKPSRIVMTSSEASIAAALGTLRSSSSSGGDVFDSSFTENDDGEGDLRGELTRADGTTIIAGLVAYGRAKLCNNLFAFELNRRMAVRKWPIIVHTVHTGSVATKTASNAVGEFFSVIPGLPMIVSNVMVPLLFRTPDVGARTLLFAALSNEPPSMKEGGQYVDAMCWPLLDKDHPPNSNVIREKVKALRRADEMWAQRLWNVSLRLLSNSPASGVVQLAP